MRPTASAAAGSLVYLALGFAWVLLARPPGPLWLEAGWIVAVAGAGLFVPGPANQVTLARAYLAAPALAYASTAGDLGLLAVTVALGSVTDLADGTIARNTKAVTTFGGGLDPVVDGVFAGAIGIGLTIGGAIPVWLAAVAVARYLLPALAGGLLLASGRRVAFRHTLTGQISTVLILVLLGGIALLRGLDQDPGNWVLGAEVVIPIATVATFIHLGYALRRQAAPAVGRA
jgi:CDP-diacylglycerol---glycerol-3-phosphate 3-phosphatidyltransferase